ncbi:MAG: DUF4271 domain-containing protein [Bacteroidota bacterium]
MKHSFYTSIVVLVLMAVGASQVAGQDRSNPFELSPRMAARPAESGVTAPASETPEVANPFDIVTARAVEAAPKATISSPAPTVDQIQLTKKDPETPQENRFRLTLTFIILAVVTILVTLFRPYINRVNRAVFNENLLSQYFRERETGRYLPYNLLYLLFFINLGFFIYLLLDYYGLTIQVNPYYSFSLITIAVAGLFVLKQLVLLMIGYIFPVAKEADLYSFSITIFSIFLGLVLIPTNLLVAYVPENLTFAMVVMGLGIIALVYALLYLRGLFIANKFSVLYFFHFLLYICTVEIAPLVLIGKFIKDVI